MTDTLKDAAFVVTTDSGTKYTSDFSEDCNDEDLSSMQLVIARTINKTFSSLTMMVSGNELTIASAKIESILLFTILSKDRKVFHD